MLRSKHVIGIFTLLLAPAVAFAHPGHGGSSTFMQGIVHPITGIDHVLAMIAVGIWAVQQGGSIRWLAPFSFVAFMLCGALLTTTDIALPNVDFNIAVSIVVLGAAIAFALRAQPLVGAIVIGTFAILHGYAHGVEASGGLSSRFVLGMLLATLTLHIVGIGAAMAIKECLGSKALRWTGASIAVSGLALMVGA